MNPLIVQQFIDWLGSAFEFGTCRTIGTARPKLFVTFTRELTRWFHQTRKLPTQTPQPQSTFTPQRGRDQLAWGFPSIGLGGS
jgi:hypothetical protein